MDVFRVIIFAEFVNQDHAESENTAAAHRSTHDQRNINLGICLVTSGSEVGDDFDGLIDSRDDLGRHYQVWKVVSWHCIVVTWSRLVRKVVLLLGQVQKLLSHLFDQVGNILRYKAVLLF